MTTLAVVRVLVPVCLGCATAVFVYASLADRAATQELVAVSEAVQPGTRLTEKMLVPVRVYATGPAITRSAVPYADRGVTAIGRVVRRGLEAGEVVMFDDVAPDDAGGVTFYTIRPGEVALQVTLSGARLSTALIRVGSNVGFVLDAAGRARPADADDKEPGGRILGPFRVLAVNDQTDPRVAARAASTTAAQLTVAVPDKGSLDARATTLVRAAAGEGPDRIMAVVIYPTPAADAPAARRP